MGKQVLRHNHRLVGSNRCPRPPKSYNPIHVVLALPNAGLEGHNLPSGPVTTQSPTWPWAASQSGQTTIVRGDNTPTRRHGGYSVAFRGTAFSSLKKYPAPFIRATGSAKWQVPRGSRGDGQRIEIHLLHIARRVRRASPNAAVSATCSLYPGMEGSALHQPWPAKTNAGGPERHRAAVTSRERTCSPTSRSRKSGPWKKVRRAGTGTIALGWKGGIGPSSRHLPGTSWTHRRCPCTTQLRRRPDHCRRSCQPGAVNTIFVSN